MGEHRKYNISVPVCRRTPVKANLGRELIGWQSILSLRGATMGTKQRQWTPFPSLLPPPCQAASLPEPRPAGLGIAPPTGDWVFLHQLTFHKMPHRYGLRTISWQFLNWGIGPLPGWPEYGSTWQKLTSPLNTDRRWQLMENASREKGPDQRITRG